MEGYRLKNGKQLTSYNIQNKNILFVNYYNALNLGLDIIQHFWTYFNIFGPITIYFDL